MIKDDLHIDLNHRFGAILTALLRERLMSQADFIRKMYPDNPDRSGGNVYNAIRGKNAPSPKTLERMAAVLKVSPEDLLSAQKGGSPEVLRNAIISANSMSPQPPAVQQTILDGSNFPLDPAGDEKDFMTISFLRNGMARVKISLDLEMEPTAALKLHASLSKLLGLAERNEEDT